MLDVEIGRKGWFVWSGWLWRLLSFKLTLNQGAEIEIEQFIQSNAGHPSLSCDESSA